MPEVLNSDEILVDGETVNLVHVGQGDIDGSTIFHVPSIDAVVAGDVVYNNVHMMFYEADAPKRDAWIASIDAIAALNPKTVVAGHKSVRAVDSLGEHARAQPAIHTRLQHSGQEAGRGVEDLVWHGMLELHGDREQPHTLWISARAGSRPPSLEAAEQVGVV